MKNLLFGLGIAALLSGCGPDYKVMYEQSQRDRDSLMAQFDSKDSVINSYMADISEIQASIEGLTQQEELLSRTASNPEATPDTKARILNDVEAIRQLIDQNKKKLGDLQSRIRKNNVKIKNMETMIASLNSQLASKDSSVNALNEQIVALNGTVTEMGGKINTLETESAAKTAEINDKTAKLHTAYYTVGTFKELRDKKVITKEGGFIGIGKKQSVLPDFNREAFTQVDLTSTKTININKKDARLLSTHPTASYKMQRDASTQKVTSIEITDPDTFWKASKYLVVVAE